MIIKPLSLDDNLLRSYKVARVFRENTDNISGINFSPNGNFLVSCGLDHKIDLYNCHKGTHVYFTFSNKYGVDNICYTPDEDKVIHSSTMNNDAIRYLCFSTNSYIRYFTGHSKKVTGLSFASNSPTFISSSLDKTVRLWDLRTDGVQSKILTCGSPLSCFDPEGLVIAVAEDSQSIKLYDRRNLMTPLIIAPDTFKSDYNWTSLTFSPDGGTILLSTDGSLMTLIDAFSLESKHDLTGYPNNSSLRIQGDFSLDSKYVLCGSSDGHIHIWSTSTGTKLCLLAGDHQTSVQCVKHNPRYCMMATACTNLEFWLPFNPDSH